MSAEDCELIGALTTYQTEPTRRAILEELDIPTLERLEEHFLAWNWELFPDGAHVTYLITARLRDLYHRQQSLEVLHHA